MRDMEGGLILVVTTPKSLKVKNKEVYYVQSETREGIKYRVDFERHASAVISNIGQTFL
jgi:hypothetical protein